MQKSNKDKQISTKLPIRFVDLIFWGCILFLFINEFVSVLIPGASAQQHGYFGQYYLQQCDGAGQYYVCGHDAKDCNPTLYQCNEARLLCKAMKSLNFDFQSDDSNALPGELCGKIITRTLCDACARIVWNE